MARPWRTTSPLGEVTSSISLTAMAKRPRWVALPAPDPVPANIPGVDVGVNTAWPAKSATNGLDAAALTGGDTPPMTNRFVLTSSNQIHTRLFIGSSDTWATKWPRLPQGLPHRLDQRQRYPWRCSRTSRGVLWTRSRPVSCLTL